MGVQEVARDYEEKDAGSAANGNNTLLVYAFHCRDGRARLDASRLYVLLSGDNDCDCRLR